MAKQVWTIISQCDDSPPVTETRHTEDAAMRLYSEYKYQNVHVTFASVHSSKPVGPTIRSFGTLKQWWPDDDEHCDARLEHV